MEDADLERILMRIVRRVVPLLGAATEEDPPQMTCLDWVDAMPGTARPRNPETMQGRLCARLEGFSLHAAWRIHQNDRVGLEALLQYALRLPICESHLSWLADGRVKLQLRRPLKTGMDEIVLDPFPPSFCPFKPLPARSLGGGGGAEKVRVYSHNPPWAFARASHPTPTRPLLQRLFDVLANCHFLSLGASRVSTAVSRVAPE